MIRFILWGILSVIVVAAIIAGIYAAGHVVFLISNMIANTFHFHPRVTLFYILLGLVIFLCGGLVSIISDKGIEND